eukprot:11047444-Alexandrium_andersonii.AAC.1
MGPWCSTCGGTGPIGLMFCIIHWVSGTINVRGWRGADGGAGGGRTPACLSCSRSCGVMGSGGPAGP